MANKWQRILRGDVSDGLMKKGQEVRCGGGDLGIVLGVRRAWGWCLAEIEGGVGECGLREGRQRGDGRFYF